MAGWRLLLLAMVLLPAVSPGLVPRTRRRGCGAGWSGGARVLREERAPGAGRAVLDLPRGPLAEGQEQEQAKGGLNLTTRAGLLAGGDSGPSAVAGNPEDSLIIRAVRYHDEPRMPPEKRLGEVEIRDLTRWVELGLPWPSAGRNEPAGGAVATPVASPPAPPSGDRGRDHWAFRPVADPPVPQVRDTAWPLAPIDRFVLAGMERHGLAPAPAADRRTLIRRATFDLVGLPPTPDEVEAFLADDRPEAFARVVDRLLASPHYGERWGRHWLDLARYADTAGETGDYPVPEAYLYRNYVIDAFNADLPYDQFLREQIAGDLEEDADRLAATRGSSPPGSWPSPAASASTRRTTTT